MRLHQPALERVQHLAREKLQHLAREKLQHLAREKLQQLAREKLHQLAHDGDPDPDPEPGLFKLTVNGRDVGGSKGRSPDPDSVRSPRPDGAPMSRKCRRSQAAAAYGSCKSLSADTNGEAA
mgnify:CR=1 FL=1